MTCEQATAQPTQGRDAKGRFTVRSLQADKAPPEIRELAERYATPLPQLVSDLEGLELKVMQHLAHMGVINAA